MEQMTLHFGRGNGGNGDRPLHAVVMPDPARHLFFAELHRKSFLLFNDEPLSMEPVVDDDLEPLEVVDDSTLASRTWSCNADHYFIVVTEGIILVNIHSRRGWLCKKKTARFIEMYLRRA